MPELPDIVVCNDALRHRVAGQPSTASGDAGRYKVSHPTADSEVGRYEAWYPTPRREDHTLKRALTDPL